MIIWEDEHETRFDIFYELASFDLRRFLNGPSTSNFGYLDYHNANPSHFGDFDSGHVLEQMAHLADALRYLHSGNFHPSTGSVCLAHNDFKPENILIFHSSAKEYPVGKWKIADFGLSNIKQDKSSQPQAKPSYLAPRDLIVQISPTLCRRNPAGYSAPEIERQGFVQDDGRESDIWSFGCVLSLVLAFCLGRSPMVSNFNRLRLANGNDRFYEKQATSPKSFKMKSLVFDWLTNIPNMYTVQGNWVQQCVDLIFDIFRVALASRGSLSEVNPQAGNIFSLMGRPSGESIRNRIGHIRKSTGNWNVLPVSLPNTVQIHNRPRTPSNPDSQDNPRTSTSSHPLPGPGSPCLEHQSDVGVKRDSGMNLSNSSDSARLQSKHSPIEAFEVPSSSLPIRKKTVSGLGIRSEDTTPRIVTTESPASDHLVRINRKPIEQPENMAPTSMGFPDNPTRRGSAATDPSSSRPNNSPITHTVSAPEPHTPVHSLLHRTPTARHPSGSTTPSSRQSSVTHDPVFPSIMAKPDPSTRVKFSNVSMSHTRISSDGRHVAFWDERADRKALICHLSFPSHHWSRSAKLSPMKLYKGLEITPPRGHTCATVALSTNHAAIHFKANDGAEVSVRETH